MKIALTANQPHLDGELASALSECPYFIFIDSKTMHYEVVANPHRGGTVVDEISSAQIVAGRGVGAVMTGKTGMNASQMLSQEGIKVITGISGKVHGAVAAYKSGQHRRPAIQFVT
jgi:predicted Fe-Mo cluster-binding NifX family protein